MPKQLTRFQGVICKAAAEHLKKIGNELHVARTSGVHGAEVRRLQKEYDQTMSHYSLMRCKIAPTSDSSSVSL